MPSETLYEREKKLKAKMARDEKIFKISMTAGVLALLALAIYFVYHL